jgi:hypothetical protein
MSKKSFEKNTYKVMTPKRLQIPENTNVADLVILIGLSQEGVGYIPLENTIIYLFEAELYSKHF